MDEAVTATPPMRPGLRLKVRAAGIMVVYLNGVLVIKSDIEFEDKVGDL